MNTPYPMLWFDTQALKAEELYVSLFPDPAVTTVERYPEGSGDRTGVLGMSKIDVAALEAAARAG